MYCYSNDYSQRTTMVEADIGRAQTVVDWFNSFREVVGRFLVMHATEIGGIDDQGQPIIVEIDETKYFHRKYHRGQWRKGHWVFGGIERISKKCFLIEVPDRSASTLEAAIVEHILPGTKIMSDGWAAYKKVGLLKQGIYEHCVIVHNRNFVDPDDNDIHTQNIENMWMRAKRKLKRQFGTSQALFPSYLKEFQFRSLVRNENIFGEFQIVLSKMYPV